MEHSVITTSVLEVEIVEPLLPTATCQTILKYISEPIGKVFQPSSKKYDSKKGKTTPNEHYYIFALTCFL